MVMFVAACLLLACAQVATAAAADNNAANTLKVSPVRSDIEIKAGTSKVLEVTVTNLTSEPISILPIQNDFIAGDERGTPALILDADEFAPTHSLKRFMTPLSRMTIPADQAMTIKVRITVPKTAQAGGYFGAVRFAPTSPDDGGQVNLSASVASLILMTVPGKLVDTLELSSFDVNQGGKPNSLFQDNKDLNVSFRFENQGNVQVGPIGKISVQNGDDVVYEADFNNKEQRDMILPDSARRWDIPLKDIGTFGKYDVTGTFTYGSENKTIEVTKSFWVVPLWAILAGIAALIAVIGLIVGIWLFLRNYKRRILRDSGHRRSRRSRR